MASRARPLLAHLSSFHGPKLTSSHFNQHKLAEIMKKGSSKFSKKQFDFSAEIDRAFASTQVTNRLLMLDPKRLLKPTSDDTMATHNELVMQATEELGKGSMAKAFKMTGIVPSQVTQYVSHTTTAYQLPSADINVHADLGIAPDAGRSGVCGSGCVGGLTVLIDSIPRVTADQPIAMATTAECASQSWSAGLRPSYLRVLKRFKQGVISETEFRRQMYNIFLTGGLFGDGATTSVLVEENSIFDLPVYAARKAKGERIIVPQIIATHTETIPNSSKMVYVEQIVGGVHIELNPNLPKVAGANELRIVEKLLAKADLEDYKDENIRYIVHAGGPRILDDFATIIGRPKSEFKHCWDSMKEHGNCGSATIGDSWARDQEANPLKEGEVAVWMGVGPGISVSGIAFKGVRVD